MSNLSKRIRADLTAAMKARDSVKLSTLRMLQSMLRNEEIDKGRDLTDDEAINVLNRAAKQRAEAADQFSKGGRNDLADKEKHEHELIAKYLPEQLDESEIEQIAQETIRELGAESPADMGRVMGRIMGEYKGRVDGKTVQAIVSKKLA